MTKRPHTQRPAKALRAALLAPALLFAGLAPAAAAPAAGCDLSGTVLDPSGVPVAGAEVTLAGAERRMSTDAAGRFCFDPVPDGRHELVAVAAGFAVGGGPVRLTGDPVDVEIALRPAFGEELVVTGTRTAKRLADLPVHLEVVDRAKIESTASRTLADAVEWTPGLRVESNCQNCNFSQIRLLGLEGNYSQILVDSQPTVSSLAMVYGIEQIPARLIESIEVVKGGGSAVYGGGAIAGVVNLIPHEPSSTGAEVGLRTGEVGGKPESSTTALVDWAAVDRDSSLAAYGQHDELQAVDVDGDGFTEVTRRELVALGLRANRYLLDSAGRLSLDLSRTHELRRGGALEGIDLAPHETILAEEIESERLVGSLSWLHTVTPRLDYRLAASWSSTDRASYYGAGFDPAAYGTTENPLVVADGQLNRYRDRSTLTWGLQASRDRVEDVQPGYGRRIETSYSSVGAYLQDDRRLGDGVTLLYGVRVDDHSAVADPIVSPRLALLWSPRSELTVRATVARGFRPPVAFDEDLHIELVGGGQARVVRNDPALAEETSTSATASVEWMQALGHKGAGMFELHLFRTALGDLFHNLETDDPATQELELTKTNLGDARVYGAELVAAFRWGADLSIDLGYVAERARFSEPEPDFGSRDFFRTPERYGTASVTWQAPRLGTLFVGSRYTGPMVVPHYAGFVADDRLERTSSFVTVDASLSRSFALGDGGRRLVVTVGGKNLTDDYQPDLDRGPNRDSAYVYGPRFPRSWHLGLRLEL